MGDADMGDAGVGDADVGDADVGDADASDPDVGNADLPYVDPRLGISVDPSVPVPTDRVCRAVLRVPGEKSII